MEKPRKRSSLGSKESRHQKANKRGKQAGDIWETSATTDVDSWFDQLILWDVELTGRLGICATTDAAYGQFRPLMKLLELSCHGIPWFAFAIASILVSHQPFVLELLVNLFSALVFDILVICVLKLLASRDRPSHNQNDMFVTVSIDNKSFPSGHSTRAVMLAAFFISQFSPPPLGTMVIVFWAASVCISRVFLGRHHVLDVAAGAIVGLLEYFVLVAYFWLPRETCMKLLEKIHEETHL